MYSYRYSNLDKFIRLAETLKKGSPFRPYSDEPPLRSYQLLKKAFYEEALMKSDQMHQTFENNSLAMTHKLDDMIELPKSQHKKRYKEDLECEMVMVKIPRCMSWLGSTDAYDEPIDFPSLDVNLEDRRGLEPPIKPYSPDSFRMKIVNNLTIHTPPSPHVAHFHHKGVNEGCEIVMVRDKNVVAYRYLYRETGKQQRIAKQ
ncbi:hypothetical protein Tco_1125486 [Tanacetum coccineum]|uniref:Uncharacterized protein n=1 Tax=Tanacetum coccineum TaxID=301880 RepID=A0ABQ5J942_9ASTR